MENFFATTDKWTSPLTKEEIIKVFADHDMKVVGYTIGNRMSVNKFMNLKNRGMNYPAASGRSINPKKQKQDTPQAAGELTQKRLNLQTSRYDNTQEFN